MNHSLTNIIDDLRVLQAPRPLTPIEWLLIAAGLLLVLALWTWCRAASKRTKPLTAAEAQAVQEDALAALEKLRPLLQTASSREYAIQVSGVVRRYLERRFGLRAPRRSTEEFLLEASHSQKLGEPHRAALAEFLAACDFLKFARAYAELPELNQMHESAARFISETQPASTNQIPPEARA